MNKKLLELLNQINAQKQVVIDLANAGKLAEAKAEKEKLQQMQDKFDLLKDVEDPDPEGGEGEGSGAGDPVNSGALKNVNVNYNRVVHEFADAARHYFKDAAKANTEGTKADGGYTVPDDIRTEINRYREEKFSLQSLVDTETVTTESGRRTYQSRADYEGFAEVSEGGKISGIAGPSFEVIEYTIKKYAGWLPVTNELLADSDANIANTLIRWLGEQVSRQETA